MKMIPFEVRGVKTHRGHEGEPLRQGDLWHGGKKIGFISEGDWGGPAVVNIDGEANRKLVDEFIAAQPEAEYKHAGVTHKFKYDEDGFVDDLLTAADLAKKLARAKKSGKVCFQLPGDEAEGAFRTIGVGTNGADFVVAHVKSKYPAATIL